MYNKVHERTQPKEREEETKKVLNETHNLPISRVSPHGLLGKNDTKCNCRSHSSNPCFFYIFVDKILTVF